MEIKINDEEIYEWANNLILETYEDSIPIEEQILSLTSSLMLEHIAPEYYNVNDIPENIFELIEHLDLEKEKIEVEEIQKFSFENENEDIFEIYSIALYGLNNFGIEQIKENMMEMIKTYLDNPEILESSL